MTFSNGTVSGTAAAALSILVTAAALTLCKKEGKRAWFPIAFSFLKKTNRQVPLFSLKKKKKLH